MPKKDIMKIRYRGIELELERLPNGKYKKPNIAQFTKSGRGCTWLDDCRVPIEKGDEPHGGYGDEVIGYGPFDNKKGAKWKESPTKDKGRFPANLLVSDDVLNTGKNIGYGRTKQPYFYKGKKYKVKGFIEDNSPNAPSNYADFGSYSRYFDLDKWAEKTFPFLIVPKASKREKNKGLDKLREKEIGHNRFDKCKKCGGYILQNPDRPSACKCENPQRKHNKIKGNFHPTVKPVKLMSYLITLGSRPNDTVLDPFMGSGTTGIACKTLNRKFVGIELNKEYFNIAKARIAATQRNLL